MNFSSASGDAFLSGWYCYIGAKAGQRPRQTIRIVALEWIEIRNLHCGLAIGFLEFSFFAIDVDAELCMRREPGQKFRVG